MDKIRRTSAFTLIEVMLVSAIIGLLAAIAIPKFGNLLIKAKEAEVKGKLGSFRSALSLYYADTEGMLPGDTTAFRDGRYIDEMPTIKIPTVPQHAEGNGMRFAIFGLPVCDWTGGGRGPWVWCLDRGSGKITVNCTHPDSSGRVWSTW